VIAARFLLDTNICIYAARGKSPQLQARFAKLRPGEARLSVITFGELQFGAAKSQHSAAVLIGLQELTALIPVLPLPLEAGIEYGRIRARLEARGEPIGGNDLWIAAHARVAGLTLVTNNTGEFSRVPGLKLQNWAS
jgi:tRNA(fMet)-specific endonuclease VapC